MAERFTYPPELREEFRREARRRGWFWLLLLPPFLVLFPMMTFGKDGWIAALVFPVVASAAALFAFEFPLRNFARRTGRMIGQALEHDGTTLRQIAPDGKVLAEINLGRPFSVGYPSYVAGDAVYQVTQGGSCLKFSSRISGGERLVREILRHLEWPPGADAT